MMLLYHTNLFKNNRNLQILFQEKNLFLCSLNHNRDGKDISGHLVHQPTSPCQYRIVPFSILSTTASSPVLKYSHIAVSISSCGIQLLHSSIDFTVRKFFKFLLLTLILFHPSSYICLHRSKPHISVLVLCFVVPSLGCKVCSPACSKVGVHKSQEGSLCHPSMTQNPILNKQSP